MDETPRPTWPARYATWLALLVIALAIALTQFGEMLHETLDPDEASFILMGADVASGHLPFVEQFDLKPPMIFLVLGGVIALFGKSLIAIRLTGDLFLFVTAALIFQTVRRMTGTAAALGGALLYVAMTGLDFGQPTYSELPATAFLMTAVLALCRAPVTLRSAAIAGLAVSLAVLTRTNLYPIPIGVGLLLLAANCLRTAPVVPKAWLAFGFAGLVPPALLVLVYAAAGEIATLKLAMIDVPLAYSGQVGPLAALKSHVEQFHVTVTMAPLVLIPAVLLIAAGIVAALWRAGKDRDAGRRWDLLVLFVLTGLAGLSVIISGAAYPHYWLQILPFLAFFAAFAFAALGHLLRSPSLAPLIVALPLASALCLRAPDALALASAPSHYNAGYDIAAATRRISASNVHKPRVWSLYKHLIHWYLGAPQLSRAGVHPDNLARHAIIDTLADHGYVSRDEIGRIMHGLPDFVVTDTMGRGVTWVRGAGKPVDAWLAQHYHLDARFGEVLVYRRNQSPASSRNSPALIGWARRKP